MKLTLLSFFTALTLMATANLGFAQDSGTAILTESFDTAASTEGWNPAGDAASRTDEATFEWAETAGINGTGALRIGGVNADGDGGRGYVFGKTFTEIDFGGQTNVTVSVSIKTESLVGTNVFVLTNIAGSVVQSTDGVISELSDTEYTTFTFDHTGISTDANSVFVEFNIAAGADVDLGGTVLVDDITVTATGGSSGGGEGEELLTNGDFQTGDGTGWRVNFGDETVPLQTVEGNTFFIANVETAVPDQPFLVNLSQVLSITQGENYTLTFDASTGEGNSRTIIAGIGLDEAPFTANTETITLADTIQTFTLNFTAGFGGPNSRVLFDMAGAAGIVVIDNVSLVQGGEGTPVDEVPVPTVAAPTPPERNAADVISLFSDAYTNIGVSSFATEWSQGATVTDVEIEGNNTKLYNIPVFFGIQLENTIDLTDFTHLHFDYWIADNPLADGAIMNPKLSNHAGEPTTAGETSAIGFTYPVSTAGEWVSVDLVLEDFVSESANGLLDREKIFQILFTTAGKPENVYIDNLYFWKEGTGTSVDELLPVEYSLNQNYPNPFNPTTSISYSIPQAGQVNLEIFNLQGQRVALIESGFRSAGSHSVSFDASNLSSGIYLYRLQVNEFSQVRRMTLIK